MDVLALKNNYEQERDARAFFGFWIYLMSDLILFSVLFASFGVYRNNFAQAAGPKDLFDTSHLFFETLILLTSSFTYGIAMFFISKNEKGSALVFFILTFVLGAAFLVMEVTEFSGMISSGNGPSKSAFLSSFFTLVGTHGLHVTFGLIWLLVMILQLLFKPNLSRINTRLNMLSLFWHFLDIIWVGVFTFVYLFGLI